MLFAAVTSRTAIQASLVREARKICTNRKWSERLRKRRSCMCVPRKTEWASNFCRVLTCGGCEPRPSPDSMRFFLQPSSTALAIGARCLPGFCGTSRSNVSDHTSDHVNYSCCLIQPFQIGLNPLPTKSSNILWFQAHRKIEKRLQVIHTAYILLRAGISSSTLALYLAMIPQIIKTHC